MLNELNIRLNKLNSPDNINQIILTAINEVKIRRDTPNDKIICTKIEKKLSEIVKYEN